MNITAKAQSEIMDSMHESATTLAENSGGLFSVYEPGRFSHQTLSVTPSHYRVDGHPIEDVDVSDTVAGIIDSRYSLLPSVIEEHDQSTGAFTQMGHILKSGQNVGIGMGHAELIDIALYGVGTSNFFRRRGINHKAVLVASKAIDFLGVDIEKLQIDPEFTAVYLKGLGVDVEPDNTVQVRDFLRLGFDHIYLTVPATRTFSKVRGVQGAGIKWFNSQSTSSLEKALDRSNEGKNSPTLLNVALPGTTMKRLDIEAMSEGKRHEYGVEAGQDVEVIGAINPAIARFMGQVLLYASEIRLDHVPPAICVDKDFVCLSSEEDMPAIAGKLVGCSASLEPGKKFIYDESGELPVIRK